jgi:hypothetical protein
MGTPTRRAVLQGSAALAGLASAQASGLAHTQPDSLGFLWFDSRLKPERTQPSGRSH